MAKPKHKTASETANPLPAADSAPLSTEPPKDHPEAQTTPPRSEASQQPPVREPGDDTASEPAAAKKDNWKPWTDIAVPLTEEAKRDHTKGEVARHHEGYNYHGVGVRIDSPDESFRPSEYVKEPLKEAHPGRESMRWNREEFHKKVAGTRRDGSQRNPVAERLDAEDRFAEMVQRRREELDKADGGRDRDPF